MKQQTNDIFEAAQRAKLAREKEAKKAAVGKWFADHVLELLTFVIAVWAFVRTF